MTPEQHQTTSPDTSNALETTVETALERAQRAFAFKKYEQAIELYASALELQTKKHGEDAPEVADLYFSYGRALLENAISQASVLGKDPEPVPVESEKVIESNANGPILSFSGDGDEYEDEDGPIDLLGQSSKQEHDDEDEGDDEEPEDDFNAAWEVLELARSLYEKGKDSSDEVKLKLADTYITLGDVSLETEKFDQAITDYSAGLVLKTELLPLSSRQIAEAHYKLSIVLDLTSGRLSDAITHAETALESVLARISEIKGSLGGKVTPISEPSEQNHKGKERLISLASVSSKLVQDMTPSQMQAELHDLESLKDDLAAKVEELKTIPLEPTESAPSLAAKALDQELNARSVAIPGQQPVVHDLTSMVKKKKPVDSEAAAKRKADEEVNCHPKKPKLEESPS